MLAVALVHSRLDYERRAGRPSSLPDASTPVGPERGGSTDLTPEDSRPHNWCSHQSALVAGSGTNSVQAGCSVQHGDATRYLGPLTRVDDLLGLQTLRSTSANHLVVPPVKLSTVSSRTFAVAAARI